jgi:hypothetical protein
MNTDKLARILTACYVLLAGSAIAYELSIRIFDRGNSEFAGMLSVVLTFPASLILIGIGKEAFGVNVGDSDASFVVILGLSALTNACIVWMISRSLSRPK